MVDAIGEPIIGASVLEMGTTNGTITDVDGNFTLQVPEGTKLEVSFLGYKSQQIVVGAQSHYKVVLKEDTEVLDEVVVVGYGVKQKRSTMTTAISKMDSKVLENAAIANAAQALQGSVSGLRVTNTSGAPGSSPTIVLRGGAGIESAGSPLVVVDGVVRSMDDVNPADIESIQVLKDAASTAIYGARANNGVILVQTKKGKEGVAQISYKFKGGLNFARKGYEYMDAENYIKYGRLGRQYSGGSLSQIDGMRGYGAVYGQNNPEQFSIRYLDGNEDLLQEGWKQMTDPISGKQIVFKDYGTTLRDEVYKDPAFTQDHYLSFTGGNEKGTFAASLGYYSEDGTVKGTQYRRFSGTLNGNYKVLPILNIKGGVNFSTSEAPELYYDDTADLFERLQSVEPTWNPYLPDGSPNYGYGKRDGNPLYWLDKLTNQNNTRRTTLNIGADLELIKDKLYLRENSSLYYSDYTKETFDKAYRDYWNENTERKASFEYTRTIQQQHSLQLEYTDTFKEKHNLSAMVGGEYFENQYLQYKGTADGAPFDQIPTLNVSGRDNMWSYSYRQGYRIASGFARVTYDYERRYLFTAVARYDGVSKLSDNRWGFFPGVSAGWNMHREAFFEPLSKVVSNLKLRASWGKTGYDNLALENTEGSYEAGKNYAGEAGILNTVLMNRNLLWEETTSTDLGLEAGFLNNRINLSFDAYYKKTTNRLLNENLWSETGFASIKSNFGSLNTKGVEIAINAIPIQTHDFRWNIDANFSIWRTTIGKLPNNGADKNRTGGGIIFDPKLGKYVEVGGFAEGERFGSRFAYQLDGVYATDEDAANAPYDEGVSSGWLGKGKCAGDAIWRDVDGNGIINSKDMVFVGYIHPDKMGSFNNTFTYKNFTLRIATDFSLGNVIDNHFRAQANANSRNNFATIHDVASSKMWHKPGDIASIPRYDVESDWDNGKRNHGRPSSSTIGFSGGSANTLYIKKGDYLAFREVSLSYPLRTKWLRAAKIETLDLTAAVYNLGYWTAYDGLTPEVMPVNIPVRVSLYSL